ncbi:unnamed protein product, partial [marine sediment metagenome]
CLLYPASNGVPTWETEQVGERAMVKLPQQFMGIFKEQQPLSEAIGRELSEWAAGKETAEANPQGVSAVIDEVEACADAAALRDTAAKHGALAWSRDDRAAIGTAINARKEALKGDTPPCGAQISDDVFCALDAEHTEACRPL